jgi:hypothetical protein
MGFLQDKCCEHKQNVASMRIQNVNKDWVFKKKKKKTWQIEKIQTPHIYCRKSNNRNNKPSITLGNIGR